MLIGRVTQPDVEVPVLMTISVQRRHLEIIPEIPQHNLELCNPRTVLACGMRERGGRDKSANAGTHQQTFKPSMYTMSKQSGL